MTLILIFSFSNPNTGIYLPELENKAISTSTEKFGENQPGFVKLKPNTKTDLALTTLGTIH